MGNLSRTGAKNGGGGSVVDETARALRAYALSRNDGEFLGSEGDLVERLGVSRPTLRQASAQVLQENLISIRRGAGGGYFSRRPESLTVSRMASLYLQSHGAGLEEMVLVMKPIRLEIALLAARTRDPEALAELRAFIEREQNEDNNGYRAFLRSEREFGGILSRMSGNRVLNLFLAVLYDLSANVRRDEDVLINRRERVRIYRKLRAEMAAAIINGDEEITAIATGRCSMMIAEWMEQDLTGRSFGDSEHQAAQAEREASESH